MSKKKGRRCPHCRGTGNEVSLSTLERRASSIMGIPTVEYKRCSWCQGTGWLNFNMESRKK